MNHSWHSNLPAKDVGVGSGLPLRVRLRKPRVKKVPCKINLNSMEKRTYRTKKVIEAEAKAKIQTQINYWVSLILVVVASSGVIVFTQTYTEAYIVGLKHSFIEIVKAEEPIVEYTVKSKEQHNEEIKNEVIRIAEEAEFEWVDYLLRLMNCENLRYRDDYFDPFRDNAKGNKPAGSIDRGLFMINDHWHDEIAGWCAHDLECSTKWTIKRINAGYQSEWVCDTYIRANPDKYR